MGKNLSFGQRIGLGFTAVAGFALLIGALAVYALRSVVDAKDRVITVHAQNLIEAAELEADSQRRVAANRAFMLTGDTALVGDSQKAREEFDDRLGALARQELTSSEEQALTAIAEASQAQRSAADQVIELRKGQATLEEVAKRFQADVIPQNRVLSKAIDDFVRLEEQQLQSAKTRATESADFLSNLMVGISLVGMVVAVGMAVALSRMLGRQINSAVQHIQNSSTELQAAANQQTTSSREQAASTNEIATTIKELVATARQIADSAQRVAGIAEETARGARSGDQTVQKTHEAVGNIKRQVDLIVNHMLDLGRKSQQIGGILEIINELAEQTNILAINASIEAAGAGEVGSRFGVVADEIRKLADRVAASTKEIRSLIEEIRSAVHTTIMTTETGSKAVEGGTRQFGDVSAAFQQIVRLVETTTEAAREIELSTKQQTTAVEQVNLAIANVAQAAKESETSSTQTLQTVSELTALSRDLARLIQPQASV
jgi:methyl-accepting chemotaxis protein